MTLLREIAAVAPPHPGSGQSGSALAVAGVIAAMALVAIGNGLMFAFIPVRLDAEGFAPTWAGAILAGLSLGGMAGCLLTARLIRRLGHVRAFAALAAMILVSNLAIAAGADPYVWLVARLLYGFAISGLFIVAQSWLNDAVANAIRGRVMAIFYVCYVMGLGAGAFLLRFLDVLTAAAPAIAIAFAALSMVPAVLTRLAPPPASAAASLAFRSAWLVSPAAMAGMLASGGLTMMVAGFAPIHATATGFTQTEVATLLLAMPLGTLLFQIPLGWISDRRDRRAVMIAASLLSGLAGVAAYVFDGSGLAITILIYIVWSGTSESLYSLSSAHANDRAGSQDRVALSSTMLFAWSFAGFFVPALATVLTAAYGTQSFIIVAIATAAIYCGFVAWRTRRA